MGGCAYCYTMDDDKRWECCDMQAEDTCGGTANGAPCHFPYTYKGKEYTSCTSDDHHHPWCSTTKHYIGRWGNCECQAAGGLKDNLDHLDSILFTIDSEYEIYMEFENFHVTNVLGEFMQLPG